MNSIGEVRQTSLWHLYKLAIGSHSQTQTQVKKEWAQQI